MGTRAQNEVLLGDGSVGVIETWKPDEGHGAQALLRLSDGTRVWVPTSTLSARPEGGYALPIHRAQLEREHMVIPVMAEAVTVSKRVTQTGVVRLRKVVHEREEVVDASVVRESVRVERVPIHRVVDGPVPLRQEGDVLIVPVLEEVLVVEKRLMLREELRIVRERVSEPSTPRRVTLRTEEIVVERDDSPEAPARREPH